MDRSGKAGRDGEQADMIAGGGEAGERSGGAEMLEPTKSGTDGGGTAIPKKDLKTQQQQLS